MAVIRRKSFGWFPLTASADMGGMKALDVKGGCNVCAVCKGADTFEPVFGNIVIDRRPFDIHACKFCGLGKTVPLLDDDELSRLYSSDAYRFADAKRFPRFIEEALKYITAGRCGRVERFAPAQGRLLDIGCGRADFLAMMKKRGWNPTGIEVDERIQGRGERMGLDLRNGRLDDTAFEDNEFDAVTMWHVFEHMNNPLDVIGECARILKQGGLIVIAVPNAASLQSVTTGKDWFHLDPPFHLYHYSLDNIAALLEGNGFSVKKVRQFSFEYAPFGFFQSILNAAGFGRNLFYDFLRKRAEKSLMTYLSVLAAIALMPVLFPASLMLSVVEAVMGRGGAIEVYAVKK